MAKCKNGWANKVYINILHFFENVNLHVNLIKLLRTVYDLQHTSVNTMCL